MARHVCTGDITQCRVDAIINAAKNSLLGGGGVDGAIHRAAGDGLLAECRALGGCETGKAKITRGYDLKAKYVIHTVGPIWHGGGFGEEELLRSCYRSCFELVKRYGLKSVATPLVSAGVYGYPKKEAYRIATQEADAFLRGYDAEIYIVLYGGNALIADECGDELTDLPI